MTFLTHTGKHPYNAETTINYEDKSVSFTYPQEITRKNTWKAYADNVMFQLPGVVVMYFLIQFFLPFLLAGVLFLNYEGVSIELILILSMLSAIWLIMVMIKLASLASGGISIIAHENSAWLRRMYPKTNAILHLCIFWIKKKLGVKRVVDFSKIPNEQFYLTKKYIMVNNLLIMNYNIVYSEYDLTGDAAKLIKKIHSKCTEDNKKKRNNPGVTKFKIVFEFSERPKTGTVVIW